MSLFGGNIMNRQVIDLGFILKQIPEFDFSMDNFDDRLKLQKLLYLLQSCGIYLGYDFSWYLRGPYCVSLTINAYALKEIYDDIPDGEVKFKKSDPQKKFKRFLEFVKGKEIDELEIAASLHYLKKTTTLSDDKIINKVVEKQVRFTKEQVDRILEELKKCQIV